MVDDEDRPRRRHHSDDRSVATGRRRKSTKRRRRSHQNSAGKPIPSNNPLSLEELRKVRVDYHTQSPEEKKRRATRYVYEPRTLHKVEDHEKVSSSTMSRKSAEVNRTHRHKRRRVRPATDEHEDHNSDVYVYRQDRVAPANEGPVAKEDEEIETDVSSDSDHEQTECKDNTTARHSRSIKKTSRPIEPDRLSLRDKRVSSRSKSGTSKKHSSRRHLEPIHEDSDSAGLSRTKPAREVTAERPKFRRTITTSSSKLDATPRKPAAPLRSNTDPIQRYERRPSTLFSSLFGAGSTNIPEKKVTCLTCLSEDISASKAAKLSCSHHMCHACLKRIFKMSVMDPAHMPPKCCTDDHIPLKHVEKLFDTKFKMKWNKKYQEYMTRNRIYCPARRCGEWIKPSHIHIEHGRKVGVCKRCHTRVCCLCNNKMHKSRECPNDEATKEFIEKAKMEGWQRCFNCKAMVELKEGCNHMTCRCTAQFCMICGAKWKTCDCPWFNYNAIETDRLLYMNIAEARQVYANGEGHAPLRYHEELDRLREQQRQDEMLAHRMQALGTDDDAVDDGGHVNIVGIGNAGNHFLNDDFVSRATGVLTGNFRQAQREANALLNGNVTGRENPLLPGPFEFPRAAPNPPRQSMRRQHTAASRAYNSAASTRRSERVIPARRTTHYNTEAARHQPARPTDPAGAHEAQATPSSSRRSVTIPDPTPGVSALIGGADPTTWETHGRIENWMNSVHLGS